MPILLRQPYLGKLAIKEVKNTQKNWPRGLWMTPKHDNLFRYLRDILSEILFEMRTKSSYIDQCI